MMLEKTLTYQIDRVLDKAYVPLDERDVCLRWAFGQDYGKFKFETWAGIWNERHKKHLKLTPDEIVMEVIFKIGLLYMKHGRETKS